MLKNYLVLSHDKIDTEYQWLEFDDYFQKIYTRLRVILNYNYMLYGVH